MYRKFKATRKVDGVVVRCCQEDEENFFVYAKGRSRYGRRYTKEDFLNLFEEIIGPSEKERWEKAYKKIVKLLSESGLWENIKERAEVFLKYGYDVWKQIRQLEHDTNYSGLDNYCIEKIGKKYYLIEDNDLRIKLSKEYYSSLYSNYINKYPEYFHPSGAINLGSFEYAIPTFKSMYFGKYSNNYYKSEIKKGLSQNQKVSFRTNKYDGTGYDTSFEYDPERKMAWYSEEYRGCGNGHYYLALNGSCAIFCEDD